MRDWTGCLAGSMLLTVALTVAQAQDLRLCPRSEILIQECQGQVQLLIDDFSRELQAFRSAHEGQLPASPDQFRTWLLTENGDEGLEVALLLVDATTTPGLLPFGYTFHIDGNWNLATTPGRDEGYHFRATAVGEHLASPTGDEWQEMPRSVVARIAPWDGRVQQLWSKRNGADDIPDDFTDVLSGVGRLALLQSLVQHDPPGIDGLVASPGILDVSKVYAGTKRARAGGAPYPYNKAIRLVGGDGWEVVYWPKEYGVETKLTYCQDDQGNVRVGDMGGSDDCSAVPCF